MNGNFAFEEPTINCKSCGLNRTTRIKGILNNSQVYLSHPIYGIAMVTCPRCELHSIEFVHPKVVSRYFDSSKTYYTPEALIALHNYQTELCQSQTQYFVNTLRKPVERILIIGSGRSLYIQPYKHLSEKLYLIEFVPAFRDWAKTQDGVNVLEEEDLLDDNLVGKFDVIILTNVLQRVVFVKTFLSRCSRLLNLGGRLVVEVPITSLDDVRKGCFGSEELNFFNEESLKSLVINQDSFKVANMVLDSTLRDDPSTVKPNRHKINLRPSLKVILNNENPNREQLILDYNKEELKSYMKSLSCGCFIVSNDLSFWSDDQNIKERELKLSNGNSIGH